MPTYTFDCLKGHRFDRLLKVKDYNDPQTCECGSSAERKIVPTMLSPDIANWDRYISPASGKLITSHKDRRRDMQETGCVDYEPSLRENADKDLRNEDLALEKTIDNSVDEFIEKLPSDKKERLANELDSGADIEYKRI